MGFVRYILAFAVLVAHFNVVFGCSIPFMVSSYNAVGGFFALSGFLLYGSYMRQDNVKVYLIKRARRLLPPYVLIICLCAFLLSFVSVYSWKEYFINVHWVKYLVFNLSFLNFLQPSLPGVFADSHITAVNGSLWTMKVEWMLYFTVPVIYFFVDFLYRKNKVFNPKLIFIFIYLVSLVYRLIFMYLYDQTNMEIYQILGRQFIGQMMYFYSGVFIYFIYDIFRRQIKIIVPVCIILYFLTFYIPYLNIVLGPVIVSSLVIAVSSCEGFISRFNYNNLSYDIYLFHFPIIQLFYQYRMNFNQNIPLLFILSLLAIIGLSLFSWFCIEKKFLPKNFI